MPHIEGLMPGKGSSGSEVGVSLPVLDIGGGWKKSNWVRVEEGGKP